MAPSRSLTAAHAVTAVGSGHEGCRPTEPTTVRTGKNAAWSGLSRTTAPATSGPSSTKPATPARPSRPLSWPPGDEETTAVCQVAGLASAGDGTIVHLKLLPGLADGYRQLVE